MLFTFSLAMFCILGIHLAGESLVNKNWSQLPLLVLVLACFVYVSWTKVGPMGLSVSLFLLGIFTFTFIITFGWSYGRLFSVVERHSHRGQIHYDYYPPQPYVIIITMIISSLVAIFSVIALLATPLKGFYQPVDSVVRREEHPLILITSDLTMLTKDGTASAVSYCYSADNNRVLATKIDPSVFDFIKTNSSSRVVMTYLSRDYVDTSIVPPYHVVRGCKTWTDTKFYINPEETPSISDLAFLYGHE